ncbi:MAG: hypothetical protein ABR611_09500 [Chthoniobacterales bacterium]
MDRYPQTNYDRYSNPDNWMPAEVPNNTAQKQFNVTIGDLFLSGVEVDVDATISNLTLASQHNEFSIWGTTLTVTGTTTIASEQIPLLVWSSPDAPGPAKFNAGTLSAFSNHTLSGIYQVGSGGITFSAPATLQFTGADIWTLRGYLSLSGPLSTVVDESGKDALRNLAHLEKNAILYLQDHELVTNAPFSNDGSLGISQYNGPASFTAAVALSNFDPSTRTITGGAFHLDAGGSVPAELRFNGADIVNLASELSLRSATARIADLTGNDGLRNFARILPAGSLTLYARNLTIPGQFQNDGSLSLFETSTFAVNGGFTNFDPSTRTLTGGTIALHGNTQLRFADADIVHNASTISLSDNATITDLTGNNALRNFSDNLSGGEFVIGNSSQFTTPGDFTNAGQVKTEPFHFYTRQFLPQGRFLVPAGFNYTQTGGSTINGGYLAADRVDILGGTFSGQGTVKGDVTIKNATISPAATTAIQGNLTLQPDAHFRYTFDFNDPQQITGKVTLAGILEIDVPADRFISSTTLLTVLKSATPLTGVFSNAPDGARIRTVDGKGSMTVSYGATEVTLFGYQPEPPPAQLLNISSRAFLSAANDDSFGDRSVLIGGFIITGIDHKDVVLRGLGPSLAQYGLNPVLADPTLELRSASGALIAGNDNWTENRAQIVDAGLAPTDDREAALRVFLAPGTYTVLIREKNGRTGSGLVEIYDLTQNTTSKLANISTRGFTDASNFLIGGIIAGGSGQANADIVVRALGPELRNYGIMNALGDPTLEVRDANGGVIGFNDDWFGNYPDPVAANGLAPSDKAESAIYLSLPPGNYTAIVRARANSGGVALVEFYDLRR